VLVFAANGALAAFNMNIPAPRTQYIWGLKGDVQFSPRNRVSIRGNGYDQEYLSGGGATSHPSTGLENQRFTKQVQGLWTTVLSNRMVNVVKAGYSNFNRNNHSLAGYKGGPNPDILNIPSFGWGAPPRVTFTGYAAGAVVQHHNQDLSSVRDDLTTSFDARGRHDIKTGAEYIYNLANLVGCGSRPPPTPRRSCGQRSLSGTTRRRGTSTHSRRSRRATRRRSPTSEDFSARFLRILSVSGCRTIGRYRHG